MICATVGFVIVARWESWFKLMGKDYGTMIGCNDAIKWVKDLQGVDEETKTRVLARMAYEFDKSIPIKPKFQKGLYSRLHDSYTCGNCGAVVTTAYYKYCYNCGFRIAREAHEEKQREEFKQLTLSDFMGV